MGTYARSIRYSAAGMIVLAALSLGGGLASAQAPTGTATAASSATTTTTPSGTATATPTPIVTALAPADAAAFRDALLALAMTNLDAQVSAQFNGFFPAWKAAYPTLGGSGSAVTATPVGVSTLRNLLDSKSTSSPSNPTVIAFAVADTQGRCAGAVIYGFPKADTQVTIASPSPCNAQAVAAAFRATFQAATPPPATTATASASPVPAPPRTGNTAYAEGGAPLALFGVASGVALLGMAGALLAAQGRR